MNFSDSFNMNIKGHEDILFVDVDLATDNKLFIDPTLIQGQQNVWCAESQAIIDDYFARVFIACQNRDKSELRRLFACTHEPNETRFGLSANKPLGKGNNPEKLTDMFFNMDSAIFQSGIIQNAAETNILLPNFNQDRMSDLLTNVLRFQLYQFTRDMAIQFGIPLGKDKIEMGPYWDVTTHTWKQVVDYPLLVEDEIIILVPKCVVRKDYVCSVERYIWQRIFPQRQAYHLDQLTSLAVLKKTKKDGEFYAKPPKQSVYQHEVRDSVHKEYALSFTYENPGAVCDFYSTILSNVAKGKYTMSDSELNRVTYGRFLKTSA